MSSIVGPIFNIFFLNKVVVSPVNSVWIVLYVSWNSEKHKKKKKMEMRKCRRRSWIQTYTYFFFEIIMKMLWKLHIFFKVLLLSKNFTQALFFFFFFFFLFLFFFTSLSFPFVPLLLDPRVQNPSVSLMLWQREIEIGIVLHMSF